MQKRVVLWGTAGAIVVRALLTLVVVWLLKIPAFLLVGGLALVYIGWRLDAGRRRRREASLAPQSSVRGAIQTIIVADAVMGIDNVLAVGGAAQGSMLLVVDRASRCRFPSSSGARPSSCNWVERFPAILWLGAAVLGWTAAKMIASEPLLRPWLDAYTPVRTALYVAIVGGLDRVFRSGSAAKLQRQRATGRGARAARRLADVLGLGRARRASPSTASTTGTGITSIVDLIRWVGWIPIAIWLNRRIEAQPVRASQRPGVTALSRSFAETQS